MPYAPGVQSRSDAYIAQGASNGGQMLRNWLLGTMMPEMGGDAAAGAGTNPGDGEAGAVGDRGGAPLQPTWRDQMKSGAKSVLEGRDRYLQDQDETKRRSREATALENWADAAGLASKDELKPLSLEQKRGTVEGRLFKQRFDRMNDALQKQKTIEQQTMGFARQLGGAAPGSTGLAPDDPEAAMDPNQPPAAAPMSWDNVAGALSRNPMAALNPQLDNLITSLKGFATKPGAAEGPPQLDTFELPFGNKGAALRGSKDLKVFPDTSKAPEEISPGVWRDAKGGLRQFKDVQQQTQLDILREEMKSINHGLANNPYLTENDKKELKSRKAEIQSQLDGIFSSGEKAAAPAASPNAQTGDRVKVISSDGRQYTLPKSQVATALKQGYSLAP